MILDKIYIVIHTFFFRTRITERANQKEIFCLQTCMIWTPSWRHGIWQNYQFNSLRTSPDNTAPIICIEVSSFKNICLSRSAVENLHLSSYLLLSTLQRWKMKIKKFVVTSIVGYFLPDVEVNHGIEYFKQR